MGATYRAATSARWMRGESQTMARQIRRCCGKGWQERGHGMRAPASKGKGKGLGRPLQDDWDRALSSPSIGLGEGGNRGLGVAPGGKRGSGGKQSREVPNIRNHCAM